jgi:DNA-binding HxlR family transcriptional regulator
VLVTEDWTRDNCAVGNTLAVIGERWTLLVLREAFLGVRRFEQLQRNTGMARNILSDRLNRLVAHGVLRRDLYQERPRRYEYRLTEKGLDLYPVLLTIMDWGAKHLGGSAMTLTHKSCGATVMPHIACPACGEHVTARDVRAVREEAPMPASA